MNRPPMRFIVAAVAAAVAALLVPIPASAGPVLPVAEYDDDAAIIDADVIREVGLRGDGLMGAVTRWSSR